MENLVRFCKKKLAGFPMWEIQLLLIMLLEFLIIVNHNPQKFDLIWNHNYFM